MARIKPLHFTRLIAVLALTLMASVASAEGLKVFVSLPPLVQRDGFAAPVPRELADSVADIKRYFLSNGNRLAKTREQATIILEVTGREERDGNYIVHAQAIFREHRFELTGRSSHQWKHAAGSVAEQFLDWIKANHTLIDSDRK